MRKSFDWREIQNYSSLVGIPCFLKNGPMLTFDQFVLLHSLIVFSLEIDNVTSSEMI